ncbi:MAG TPA: ATP-binding protein [Mycobacteriales bacterium]|nr:ATP-binding protein [Mycobacteriales bacterium]
MRVFGLPRPRSVRARLVAVYTFAALVLGLAGAVIFTLQLRAGLRTSLDVALDARLAPLAAALGQPGRPDLPDQPPNVAPVSGGLGALEALTAVYDPAGGLAMVHPRNLPEAPLTAAELSQARSGRLRLTRAEGAVRVRLLAAPVRRGDGTWVIVVGTDQGTAKEAVDQVDRGMLVGGVVVLGLVAAGAWLASGAALRPVERLRRDAAELGAHDPAGRLTEPATQDELAALARTFNALLDRLHRSLARQRDLVADAGHELRTPLSVLRVELELADRPGRGRAELAEAVRHARAEVERLSRLADDLLFLARADGAALLVQPRRTELAGVLAEAASGSRAVAGQVTIVVGAPAGLVADVDPRALRRALDNLLSNAIRATAPAGRVSLWAAATGSGVVVTVEDSGPGFPPAFLPYAFERFRRAEPSRSATDGGSGLGLAIVAEIAAAHGGTATATNRAEGGARVEIRLPARTGPGWLAGPAPADVRCRQLSDAEHGEADRGGGQAVPRERA